MLGDEVRDPRHRSLAATRENLVLAYKFCANITRKTPAPISRRVVSSAYVELPTISLSLLSPQAPRKNNIQGSVAAALSF